MVSQSTYIGLYQLLAVEKTNNYLKMAHGHSVVDRRAPAYNYKLELIGSVKGRAPHDLELIGVEPFGTLPSYYLALFQIHEWMADKGPTYGGLGSALVDFDEVGCAHVPKLMAGFNYLIFGGIDSQAGFEPIFFPQADKFYQVVRKLAGKAD